MTKVRRKVNGNLNKNAKQGNGFIVASNDYKHHNFNNIYLITAGILAFIIYCYSLLSFNANFTYFTYYNFNVLCISILIFIITGTFTNFLINIEEIPIYPPHPLFWRFIFTSSVLYTTFFIILLIQPNINDIRNLFKILDSSLNTPMQSRSYAEDCGNYSFEVIAEKFDAFVFGHFVGWMMGSIICRNREILWFTQILWEIIEIVTCYFIPNFAECWWDQLILDIFLCNGVGIELGLIIANYLGFVRWEWCWLWSWPNVKYKTLKFLGLSAGNPPIFELGDFDQNGYEIYGSKEQKIENLIKARKKSKNSEKKGWFEPYQLVEEYFWALFGVPCQLVALMLNAFLLKLWLWIPTEHGLNHLRLIFCAIVALPSVHQAYYGSIQWTRGNYVKTWSGKVHRFGIHCTSWLIMMSAEIGVIYRAKPDDIEPMPDYQRYWLYSTILIMIVFSYILCRAY